MKDILYEGFEQGFGEEYPAAVTLRGVRVPLVNETRFARRYWTPELQRPLEQPIEISRFFDGSASVTVTQLQADWSTWTEPDRLDFCAAIDSLLLLEQPDLPAILRFILRHGTPNELSAVAPSMNQIFPRDEAFALLGIALKNSRIGKTSNIIQAIALSQHPEAEATLLRHLQSIWADTSLWEEASFINWTAYDAVTCIRYLLRVGAPGAELADYVRKLSQHACRRIRESCRRQFADRYPWLTEPEDSSNM